MLKTAGSMTSEATTTLSRGRTLLDKVLVIDGVSGSGKSALSPLLQGLARVENVLVHGVYEYLCCAAHFGKLQDDAAVALFRILADQRIYDNSISREVNVRPSDYTSVLSSHLREVYLSRLFMPDGRSALERMRAERPILHLMTHQAFAISRPIFQAFGDRLVFLEVCRHPLNIIGHWYNYIERYGTDASDFTLWIEHDGIELPWFIAGHEDDYLRGNRMDKVILGVHALWKLGEKRRASLSESERRSYHFIPFESLVINPDQFIDRICAALGTQRRPEFADIAKRQNIPRQISNAAPKGVWGEKYGEAAPMADATEESELVKNRRSAESEASAASMSILDELSLSYERLLSTSVTHP